MIHEGRDRLLGSLLKTCRKFCSRSYWKRKIECKNNSDGSGDDCQMFLFASFLASMENKGLLPIPPDVGHFSMSAKALREQLAAVQIRHYLGGQHMACSEIEEFKDKLLVASYVSPVDDGLYTYDFTMFHGMDTPSSSAIGSHGWKIGLREVEDYRWVSMQPQ